MAGARDAEGGAAEVRGGRQQAPAAGPPPAVPITNKIIARASVVGAGGAPVTEWNPASSALPVRAPRTALLAGLAEALLDEHQIDPSGRCRACGLPDARCWVLGRARELGLTEPCTPQPNDYHPRH